MLLRSKHGIIHLERYAGYSAKYLIVPFDFFSYLLRRTDQHRALRAYLAQETLFGYRRPSAFPPYLRKHFSIAGKISVYRLFFSFSHISQRMYTHAQFFFAVAGFAA